MKKRKIPVISIAGSSKTGKTTLIERLITVFKDRGIRVAVIKHHLHDFEADVPGKDTYRFKKAGAITSIISSPYKISVVSDAERDLEPDRIISRYIRGVDLIIAEGYKKVEMPRIEVYKSKKSGDPVCLDDKNLIALVTDKPFEARVPVFFMDKIEKIADFIVSRIIYRNEP